MTHGSASFGEPWAARPAAAGRRELEGVVPPPDGPVVELLVVPDCPHGAQAALILREAMDDAGLAGARFTTRVISTAEQARQWAFVGSPSFFVNGRDLFDLPGQSPGFGCRLYRCGDAVTGVPDRAAMRRALDRALQG